MKIAIAADHGGFPLKEAVVQLLRAADVEVFDLGAHKLDNTDDYPDFAVAVAAAVQQKKVERGIIICGSGVGACVAANKFKGVRAGLCHDTYSAHQGVEHDDVNVLCLGARVVGSALATDLIRAFVSARFSGEERHLRRLKKVEEIEEKQ